MVQFDCAQPGCQFSLYYGKQSRWKQFVLECMEFVEHNHDLVIDKIESAKAL